MDVKETHFRSIEQVTGQYLNNNVQKINPGTASFESILRDKFNTQDIKFSKHATQRLADRNIDLSGEQMERLQKGARLSEEKGIKDSLVLMDKYAFIVNTKSNTVITAMEQGMDEDKVFTNIDGAVLV